MGAGERGTHPTRTLGVCVRVHSAEDVLVPFDEWRGLIVCGSCVCVCVCVCVHLCADLVIDAATLTGALPLCRLDKTNRPRAV